MSSICRTYLPISSVLLLALNLLAGVTRSGGLAATDQILIIKDGNQSDALQGVSFAELRNSASDPARRETEESGTYYGCRRVLSEFAGILVTAFVSITLANHWKSSPRNLKEVSSSKIIDAAVQPEDAQEAPQSISRAEPSLAELDWIKAARTGTLRLTDDVFSAAMQWWLEYPLSKTLEYSSAKDQQLLKPVSELLKRGREEEACTLLEQVGHLDRMERDLARSHARPLSVPAGGSPLSRNSPDLATSAARMRKAVEHYYVGPPKPDDTGPTPVRHGAVLGRQVAGVAVKRQSQHLVRAQAVQQQHLDRGLFSPVEINHNTIGEPFLSKYGCAWGA